MKRSVLSNVLAICVMIASMPGLELAAANEEKEACPMCPPSGMASERP